MTVLKNPRARVALFLRSALCSIGVLSVPGVCASGPLVRAIETNGSASFVVQLRFRPKRAAGTLSLDLCDARGQSAWQLSLSERKAALAGRQHGKLRVLEERALRLNPANELWLIKRNTLVRVVMNGRILLQHGDSGSLVERVLLSHRGDWLHFLEEPRIQRTGEMATSDDFMTSDALPRQWRILSGTWHVAGVSRPSAASDPFKLVGFAGSEGRVLCEETYWFWNDYRVSVSTCMLKPTSGTGILFGWQPGKGGFGLSWCGPGVRNGGANRLRLWRQNGNQTTVLAERPAYARVGQWYRLSVETDGSTVVARVDDRVVLTACDERLIGGQCGLWVEGLAGAQFDDWSVCPSGVRAEESLSPLQPAGSLLQREFADDPFMASWGSMQADWEPLGRGNQSQYRYGVKVFSPVCIDLEALLGAQKVPVLAETALLETGDLQSNGVRLSLGAGVLTLRQGERTVGSVPGHQWPARVEFDRNKVRAYGSAREMGLSGQLLWQMTVPKVVERGYVVLRFEGQVDPETVARTVRVRSPGFVEYRFDTAPVDWAVESGDWAATTRWACVPHWSFFGARGAPIVTLWNKRRFGGDQWIEAFLAPREGTSDRMHFTAPINLNLTFCASAERMDSGYTMVYRSHDDTALLYRLGRLVATHRQIVLPGWREDQMFVYHRITQTWHRFQVEREGKRIRIWVEVPARGPGRLARCLLFDFTDANPLAGDRIGLWAWGDNGMAVARVRIAAARRGAPVASFLDPPPGSSAGRLTSINPINGGHFRTELGRWVDVHRKPVVAFEFRADPRAVLALYAEVGGQRFRASFLGEVRQDGDSVDMGTVQCLPRPDGWWHAEFPLLQALRGFFPRGRVPLVESLYLANLSTRPEHIGGLMANPKGCAISRRPAVHPSFAASAGFQLLGPVGSDLEAAELLVQVLDTTLDPAACAVMVNGRQLALGAPGLRWDVFQRALAVHLSEAGLCFRDGDKIRLVIAAPGHRAWSQEWTARWKADKTPPPAPVVTTALGPDRIDTFERDLGSWRRLGGEQGASLWRDSTTSASGRYSLRLTHRQVAGSFAAVVREGPLDVRRWPLLVFACRVGPEVQLSLLLEIGGKWYELRFTDRDSTFPVVGSVAGVRRDRKWCRVTVDLAEAVRRAGADTSVVTKIFFADTGWMNNVQDISWHVDEVRFVPSLPVGQPETLRWACQDLSGVVAYSWVMDTAPETMPDTIPEPGPPAAAVLAGTRYLHVRARDGAGNWGPPAHFEYVPVSTGENAALDAQPRVAQGGTITAPAMEVSFVNASAMDVETIRWWARRGRKQRTYTLSSEHLRWQPEKSLLVWSDPSLTGQEREALECGLEVQDTTGARVLRREWRWTVDPTGDKQAPEAPYVSYIPEKRLSRVDFEHGVPAEVQLRRSAWVFHETGGAAVGRGCARIVNLEAHDFFSAFLRKSSFPVHEYPRVSFDYRFERPGCNLNLVSVVNGDLQTIGFAGANGAYDVFVRAQIGKVDGVQQDGLWHRVDFDLGAMLRARYPNTPRFFADYLGTWATGEELVYDNPQGASLWLDNVTLYSPQGTSAAFEWQPPFDANGISGYAFACNQDPHGCPDTRIMVRQPRCRVTGLGPGRWFFHVRARDGAGNWGPPAHCEFVLERPSSR